MNQLSPVTAARPSRFIGETIEAFLVAERGNTHDLGSFDTLDAAIARCEGIHKARFYVRVTDQLSGAVVRKFYQVKKRAKGERRWSDHQSRVVHDTYAEHQFDLIGEVL